MAKSLPNTSRRGFLGGIAALSVAAVPVVAQAATLSEWDRLAAGLAIVYPRAPEALAHAKAAGMKPKQLTAVLTVRDATPDSAAWPCLMFYNDEGKSQSFRPRGQDTD